MFYYINYIRTLLRIIILLVSTSFSNGPGITYTVITEQTLTRVFLCLIGLR